MIRALRRRHRRIVWTMVLLLPPLVAAALLTRDRPAPEEAPAVLADPAASGWHPPAAEPQPTGD